MHRKIIIDLSNVPEGEIAIVNDQIKKSLEKRSIPHRKPLERTYIVKNMSGLGKAISAIHTADQLERYSGDNVTVELKGQKQPKKRRAVRKTSNKDTK